MRYEKYYNYVVRRFIVERRQVNMVSEILTLKKNRLIFKINAINLSLLNFLLVYRELENITKGKFVVKYDKLNNVFVFYVDTKGLLFWKSLEAFMDFSTVGVWKIRKTYKLSVDTMSKKMLLYYPDVRELSGINAISGISVRKYMELQECNTDIYLEMLRIFGLSV